MNELFDMWGLAISVAGVVIAIGVALEILERLPQLLREDPPIAAKHIKLSAEERERRRISERAYLTAQGRIRARRVYWKAQARKRGLRMRA